jgi:serine/threonine protein kinase
VIEVGACAEEGVLLLASYPTFTQLTDAGEGELFVKKNITMDHFGTYQNEITLHLQLRRSALAWGRVSLCRILHYFEGLLPSGNRGVVIIYEYCSGGDLTRFIGEVCAGTRTLDARKCARFAVTLLETVAYLHKVGNRLHLDLKTDNILLSEDMERVYVADMGISQVIGGEEGEEVDPLWNPGQAFIAPEMHHHGKAAMATDRWAVGVVLLQLICKETLELLLKALPGTHPAKMADRAALLGPGDLQAMLDGEGAVGVPEALKQLVLDLLRDDWRARPSNDEAVRRANELLSKM